jgi:predicted membrane protein
MIILDFSLEALDQIHRIYEAEESFEIISMLVSGKLAFTLLTMQVMVGTIIPLITLGVLQLYKPAERIRKAIYLILGLMILTGIFFMRWNVVIGGQLFSKSFYGFTSFKLGLVGSEGALMGAVWLILPFLILSVLLWLFPPWKMEETEL